MKPVDFERIGGKLRRSLVQVSPGGSGVLWEDDLIVTNAHVARGAPVGIIDASGTRHSARLIVRDDERDLAILQSASLVSAVPAEIGDSDQVHAGQLVLALGNPLGLSGALTVGVIHNTGPIGRRNWIQADVRLAPGNSGGILADAAGRVIGITTLIFNGLALAVPSNEVTAFVHRLHLKRTA